MKFSIKETIKSFKYAFSGILFFFKDTPNAIVHLLATVVVCFAGFYFEISRYEWMWITSCIFLVFTAEIFNSAIEKVVDKASPEQSELAKRSKDMAAGAVLLVAILSIIIAGFIFWPYIENAFN
ncbi:diacylglycerol kinase family protein [Paracrocinitomix mangrovi]|uniref:diacylglycerol kinase family protein n=1 Tax=Paracrocinitomix mangrovi TaxID=2862509 RepID=UPI001C8EE729|nr:diacylglycerol kinase family protein [Paracrocinitomix mangrovi]UKN01442.1 diacylglycerol kinase family protein [Paracrocinitomix mangrovi]